MYEIQQTEIGMNRRELSLPELLRALYRKKWWLCCSALLGLAIGWTVIMFSSPVYDASVSVFAPTEGDVAALNNGRTWSDSLLKPLSVRSVYPVFYDELFSKSVKEDFFKRFYLPALPQSQKDKYSSAQLYAVFSRNLAIVERLRQTKELFPTIAVAIRGDNAQQVAIWLQQFLNLVNEHAVNRLLHGVEQQNAVIINNLQRQIALARTTAKAQRLDRITQLQEKVRTVQLASVQLPFWEDEPEPFKIELMQAKIKNLAQRKSDDAFIPNLRELQAKLRYYQSLTVLPSKVVVFNLDGTITAPTAPIAPKKHLIMMVSLVSGFLMGVLLVMLQIALRREWGNLLVTQQTQQTMPALGV